MQKPLNADLLAAGLFGILAIYTLVTGEDAAMAALWAALATVSVSLARTKQVSR